MKFTTAEIRCKGLSLLVKAKAQLKKGRIKLDCKETCVRTDHLDFNCGDQQNSQAKRTM